MFFWESEDGFSVQESGVQMLPGTKSQTDRYVLQRKKYSNSNLYKTIFIRNICLYEAGHLLFFKKKIFFRDHWNFYHVFVRCIRLRGYTFDVERNGIWVSWKCLGWTSMLQRCVFCSSVQI